MDLRREPTLWNTRAVSARLGHCYPEKRRCEHKNSQEQERDDHPGKKVNTEGIIQHVSISAVGIDDSRVGNENGRKREPECAVGRERYAGKNKLSARRPNKQIETGCSGPEYLGTHVGTVWGGLAPHF